MPRALVVRGPRQGLRRAGPRVRSARANPCHASATMGTIIFLSGRSANDTLGAAGRAHGLRYEALGHDFVEVNLGDSAAHGLLNQALERQPIEFAYSAMNLGATLSGKTSDGREVNLWEGIGVPYVSLHGDSPAYFFSRHGWRRRGMRLCIFTPSISRCVVASR